MDYTKRLKTIMIDRKLRQEDIAKMVGTTQQAVSTMINKRYPNLKEIEKICDALGMEIWEFFLPKDKIAKYYKISPEAYTAAQAIDLLNTEQRAAALIMIAGYLSAVGKK